MEADKYWSAPVAQEPSSFQGRLLCIEKKPDMYWSASRMRKGQSFQQRKSAVTDGRADRFGSAPVAPKCAPPYGVCAVERKNRTGIGPHLRMRKGQRLQPLRWAMSGVLNLYTVIDKDGYRVPFRLNWGQQAVLDELHFQNVILKARQIGFTTFVQL
jgi:hypothetical protein